MNILCPERKSILIEALSRDGKLTLLMNFQIFCSVFAEIEVIDKQISFQ